MPAPPTGPSVPGASCEPIIDSPEKGWPQLALGLWELREASFADEHPFDEVNYVLEGRLVVECEGEVLELGPGETVQVSAGSAACYRAPGYARMLYVYGPNPDGRSSRVLDTLSGHEAEAGLAAWPAPASKEGGR